MGFGGDNHPIRVRTISWFAIRFIQMDYKQALDFELQATSLEYVHRARKFQAEISAVERDAQEKAWRDRNKGETSEAAHQRWEHETNARLRRSELHKNRFRAELRTDGVLLYEELLKRTGQPKADLVALDHGMLAGPEPVEEVAFAIEKLARMLSGPSGPGTITTVQ